MKAYHSSSAWIGIILLLLANPLLGQDPDAWEERQTRQQPPEIVLKAINLKKGMTVGEIGAGRGRYSVILAAHVGSKGHIYANDIDREDLDYLAYRCKRDGIENITIVVGEELDPLLPEDKLDMIFTVNSYHHFSHPVELLKNAYSALKKSGTLVIMEGVPGKGYSGHATPQEEIISQMEEAGYSFEQVAAELEKDNIYIFRKE